MERKLSGVGRGAESGGREAAQPFLGWAFKPRSVELQGKELSGRGRCVFQGLPQTSWGPGDRRLL